MTELAPEKRAVNLDECPTRDSWRHCCCGRCSICGFQKHMAIHGPILHDDSGKPWGHTFKPEIRR